MRPFLFVHINKTGGTSLWHILGQQPHHRTAADLFSEYGAKEWREITTFSIVRNPFDRAVSLYNWRRQRNVQNILEDDLSFVEFLDRALVRKIPPYYNRAIMLAPQWNWLINTRGQMVVQHIFSFENYKESVSQILQLIGRSRDEAEKLPHARKTNHAPWQEYYQGEDGERAKRIILKEWGVDFTRLNYPREVK